MPKDKKRDRERQLTIYEKWEILDQILAEAFEEEMKKKQQATEHRDKS